MRRHKPSLFPSADFYEAIKRQQGPVHFYTLLHFCTFLHFCTGVCDISRKFPQSPIFHSAADLQKNVLRICGQNWPTLALHCSQFWRRTIKLKFPFRDNIPIIWPFWLAANHCNVLRCFCYFHSLLLLMSLFDLFWFATDEWWSLQCFCYFHSASRGALCQASPQSADNTMEIFAMCLYLCICGNARNLCIYVYFYICIWISRQH